MSADDLVAEARMMCCASCGLSELDDAKLKECPACESVRYCSDECQREHRAKHEAMCKKRAAAAELRDEILFRQPESTHKGDCPICFLPLPIDADKSMLHACCSKMICFGCVYASTLRETQERLEPTCPFCRHPVPDTKEESDRSLMKRIAANDPVAIQQLGGKHYNEGDYESAFEYWTKAVELGNVDAHYDLSLLYLNGDGVEKDEKKEAYHLEEAAIAGHPKARFNLAWYEVGNKKYERAVKHFIIAAKLGCEDSTQLLIDFYKHGDVSKEEYAAALRAHQATVNAMKSPQRKAAAKAMAAGTIRFSFGVIDATNPKEKIAQQRRLIKLLFVNNEKPTEGGSCKIHGSRR